MPSMARRGGGRRAVSEINMVPFIDVMLVLLIIFMVSAPLIAPSTVDLPSVGAAKKAPDKVIEVVIEKDGLLKLRVNGRDEPKPSPQDIGRVVKRLQDGGGAATTVVDTPRASGARDPQAGASNAGPAPVIISGDRNVKYDEVMKVMDSLQKAGVQRIGLSVKSGS